MSVLRNATAKPTICEQATHLPKPILPWGLFPFEGRELNSLFYDCIYLDWILPNALARALAHLSERRRGASWHCAVLYLAYWSRSSTSLDLVGKCVAAPALLSTELSRVPPGLWRPCKSPEKRNITLLKRRIRLQKRMVMFVDINWINKQDNKFGSAAEITWKCCTLNFTCLYCLWNGLLFHVSSSFWYTDFVWFHHVSWENIEGKKITTRP